ncbi:MAG TPA: SAM-dependent methyltransferase [Acidimicrobiales bacterium]|nr:SAM-dependent methyltransferase [Acidimicrobiales bacterium]
MTSRVAKRIRAVPDPFEIDITVAHAARIYDFLLGGVDNFEIDRRTAAHAYADMPGGLDGARAAARANRAFLGRAVRWLAGEAGVRQFLDIGTGIPDTGTVHAVAQRIAPESRIVSVDNDPVVLAHAHMLRQGATAGAADFVDGDLRDPRDIVLRAEATLDFAEPVAVVLGAVLHVIDGEDDARATVHQLMDAVAPGSYLVISHGAADIDSENMARVAARLSERSHETFVWRSREQVTRFLAGLDTIAPGVVAVDHWRHDAAPPRSDPVVPFYAAVGRKPDPHDETHSKDQKGRHPPPLRPRSSPLSAARSGSQVLGDATALASATRAV